MNEEWPTFRGKTADIALEASGGLLLTSPQTIGLILLGTLSVLRWPNPRPASAMARMFSYQHHVNCGDENVSKMACFIHLSCLQAMSTATQGSLVRGRKTQISSKPWLWNLSNPDLTEDAKAKTRTRSTTATKNIAWMHLGQQTTLQLDPQALIQRKPKGLQRPPPSPPSTLVWSGQRALKTKSGGVFLGSDSEAAPGQTPAG